MYTKKYFIVIAVLALVVIALYAIVEKDDLRMYGIESTARVVNYRYIEHYENDLSNKLIQFHTISFTYNYKGLTYTGMDELNLMEYERLFEKPLVIGDTVSIIFSSEHPDNSILKK